MKFGKYIQAHAYPQWAIHYMNYKALKKIINAAERNEKVAFDNENYAMLSPISKPLEEDLKALTFDNAKPLFFNVLDKELQKVNEFYLEKERELTERLEPLLDKKNVLVNRSGKRLGNITVESLLETCRDYQTDLGRLQEFVEINDSGFRKILKKWDKRSKLMMKEVYISRHVEIQPCFNAKILSDLGDKITVAIAELSEFENDAIEESEEDFVEEMDLLTRTIEEILAGKSPTCESVDSDLVTRIFWTLCGKSKATSEALEMFRNKFGFGSVDFSYSDHVNKRSFLHEASISANLPFISACLNRNVDISLRDIFGKTALHYASMQSNPQFLKTMLEHASTFDKERLLNMVDHTGLTALSIAVMRGNEAVVSMILDNGAAIDQESPLCLAVESGNESMVSLLLARGALPSHGNTQGTFPLHIACKYGHVYLVKLLINSFKDMNELERKDTMMGWQPIFYCASEGKFACLMLLIEHGCKLEVVDESGWTPQAYAIWNGHDRVAQLLSSQSNSANSSALDSSSLKKSSTNDSFPPVPELFLPPPTIPIYGDKYIGKNTQVILQLPKDSQSFIRFFRSNISLLKITLSIRGRSGEAFGASLSASFPSLLEQNQMFEFTIDSSVNFCHLQIDIYPTFGSKIIGRCVQMINIETNNAFQSSVSSAILDRNIKVIGNVEFDLLICRNLSSRSISDQSDKEAVGIYHLTHFDKKCSFKKLSIPENHGILLDISFESDPPDVNGFLESLLDEIYVELNSSGYKRIIFLSNNPLVCLFLSLKQPHFPIIFNFSQGLHPSSPWIHSLNEAVKFSKRAGILGILVDEAPLLQVSDLVSVIKDEGLFLSVNRSLSQSSSLRLDVDAELKNGLYTLKNVSVI